jgi:CRISPR-associated endonuclease/helicase Cas3
MVLEAPTGIGKTKILLDLIRKLTSSGDYERVFYFSPLLALTDDFENKLYDAKGRSVIRTEDVDSVLTYNHVYVGSLERKLLDELEIDDVAEDYYKTQEYFESETFNQKLVITTTQRLLHVLYSNSVSNKIKLLSLKNSILVLDEVQTIPKFLLPNFISTISHIAEMMNSKILLVSATVPNQIKNTLSRMNCSQDITREYMRRTVKNIQYLDNFKIELEASKFRKNERILMIANTRRKALHLFDSLSKLYDHAIYLSSGITKRNRRALFTQLRGAEPALVVSTQVMEAGVDVSFAKLYREVSPLDSVIQAMGRLNREAESSEPATMIVFKPPNADWKPYSELEYDESLEILREVTNSQELYDRLPEYYAKIDEKNLKNRNLARELEDKIRKLEFDEVWDFIFKNVLSEDSRGSVLIPSTDEWTEVKEYYSRKGGKPRIGRRNPYAELMAELPNTPRELKIGDLFDQDLLKNDVLLPRRECINRLYDETTGLDALMRQN